MVKHALHLAILASLATGAVSVPIDTLAATTDVAGRAVETRDWLSGGGARGHQASTAKEPKDPGHQARNWLTGAGAKGHEPSIAKEPKDPAHQSSTAKEPKEPAHQSSTAKEPKDPSHNN